MIATERQTAPELTSLYQVMPAMTDFDFEQLKQSIAAYYERHGTPFWPGGEPLVDEDDRVLDGHHRLRACAELGLSGAVRVVEGWDDDDKWHFAYRSNLARRHLTIEQRRGLVRAYVERYPAATARETAAAAGVGVATVQRVKDGMRAPTDAFVPPEQTTQSHRDAFAHEDDEATLPPPNNADHRVETWASVVVGYAADPTDATGIRMRNGLPHRDDESRRREWSSGRLVLTASAPHSQSEWVRLVEEAARRVVREGLARPPETMR